MCYLHHSPEIDDYDDWPTDPVPRSYPRLTWAIPVDAAELGASLETFEALSPQIQMLRLCHRFGSAPLSAMPQEILDIVISMLYRSTREVKFARWDSRFHCFQGRCTSAEHLAMDDEEIERLWHGMSFEKIDACCGCQQDGHCICDDCPDIQEKREMVETMINEDGDWAFDTVYDRHQQTCAYWLNMLCICKSLTHRIQSEETFLPFQKILKSDFGLEAMFLHETLSGRMDMFLPEVKGPSLTRYFTSCFLVLPNSLAVDPVLPRHAGEHGNPSFLGHNKHLAFRQRTDLTSFIIGDKEKSSFARILRTLEINPSFHLTELESILASPITDNSLSQISSRQLDGWPPVSKSSTKEKERKLREYLQGKQEEVGKQQWPQLMLMAASDTVSPSP